MSNDRPTWAELNAYMDGELPTSQAAAVARDLANDPALAERVAILTRLKATVGQVADEDLDKLELPAVARKTGGRIWIKPACAAAAAAILLATTLFFGTAWQSSEPAWLVQSRQIHEDWRDASLDADPEAAADILPAAVTTLGSAIRVPDLSAARLTVSRLSTVDLGRSEGVHVGYRGTRGCRLSLLIVPATRDYADLEAGATDLEQQLRAWRIGDLAYVLLASGMDDAHFAVVAAKVKEATREQSPFDEETRVALEQSRARSRPCQA
jgi:anti-sigma factor RsiW